MLRGIELHLELNTHFPGGVEMRLYSGKYMRPVGAAISVVGKPDHFAFATEAPSITLRYAFTIDEISVGPSTPELRLDVFAHRSIHPFQDRHADAKTDAIIPTTEGMQTLPNRPTLQWIGVCDPLIPLDSTGTQTLNIHSTDCSGAIIGRVTRFLYKRVITPTIFQTFSWDTAKTLKAADFQKQAFALAVAETKKLQEALAVKIPETNITELPRRMFSSVCTPVGVVPMWLFVQGALRTDSYDSHGKDASWPFYNALEVARELTRKPIDSLMDIEQLATVQCMAARHMAYIKDMHKQPGSKGGEDKHIDSWTYPWKAIRQDRYEIDCEDGAIFAYAQAYHYSEELAGKTMLGGIMPTDFDYVPAFAILTLRPPTDTSGSGWTYHAVALKIHRKRLTYQLQRAAGKSPSYTHAQNAALLGPEPTVIVMDTSASHECCWYDPPHLVERAVDHYSQIDSAAVPPAATLFVNARHASREVRDVKIYGHIQTLVFANWQSAETAEHNKEFTAAFEAVSNHSLTAQCELTWKGKLGVPFNDVFTTRNGFLSDDLRFAPMPALSDEVYIDASEIMDASWPAGDPLYRRTDRYGMEWHPDSTMPISLKSIEEAKTVQIQPTLGIPPGAVQAGPRHYFVEPGTVTVVTPGVKPPEKPIDVQNTAILTVREADVTSQLLELLQKHNPGRTIETQRFSLSDEQIIRVIRVIQYA